MTPRIEGWNREVDGGLSKASGRWWADVWRAEDGTWVAAYTDPRENTHVVGTYPRKRAAMTLSVGALSSARFRERVSGGRNA